MKKKLRREVGFGSSLEPIVEDESETAKEPATSKAATPASLEDALALAGRWRRYALIAFAAASVFFAFTGALLWHAHDAEKAWQVVASDRDAARKELAQMRPVFEAMSARDYAATMVDLTLRDDLPTRDAVVTYLTGIGKHALDRDVPLDEQAALIATLAPDPTKPRCYRATTTSASGAKVHYRIRVADYLLIARE